MKIFDKIHNIDFTELNRVTLKGEIKEENKTTYPFDATYASTFAKEEAKEYELDDDDDGDNEPLYMG